MKITRNKIKKTRASRQASTGSKQLSMLSEPEFNPKIPRKNTLPWIALSMMQEGRKITHRNFDNMTESWRLAAVIHKLKKYFGWIIEEEDVRQCTRKKPRRRVISRYFLSDEIRNQFKKIGGVL